MFSKLNYFKSIKSGNLEIPRQNYWNSRGTLLSLSGELFYLYFFAKYSRTSTGYNIKAKCCKCEIIQQFIEPFVRFILTMLAFSLGLFFLSNELVYTVYKAIN